MSKKIITICSSAAFYKQDIEIMDKLRKMGYQVKLPFTALIMKRKNDFDVSHYKTWFQNSKNYVRKALLIRRHFDKIVKSDAVLIVNFTKNGQAGYIGGNALMEMGIAFHFKKPIFIYNKISDSSPHKEEILGMLPIFINQDLKKIKIYG